jgi:hypothetical protein
MPKAMQKCDCARVSRKSAQLSPGAMIGPSHLFHLFRRSHPQNEGDLHHDRGLATPFLPCPYVLFGSRPLEWSRAEPDLIFRKSTMFNLLTPNDKLATYAIDDPSIDGLPVTIRCRKRAGSRVLSGLPRKPRIIRSPAANLDRSPSRRNSPRAMSSSGNAAPCYSSACRSCAAAI